VPRKPKTNPQTTNGNKEARGLYSLPGEAAWGGFINVRLDEEQKTSFLSWIASASEAVPSLVDDILGEGMKIGFSFDMEASCYIVSFTGALVGGSNERYSTNSRAGTLDEALALAVWKHFYLADGDYGNYKPRNGSLMTWG